VTTALISSTSLGNVKMPSKVSTTSIAPKTLSTANVRPSPRPSSQMTIGETVPAIINPTTMTTTTGKSSTKSHEAATAATTTTAVRTVKSTRMRRLACRDVDRSAMDARVPKSIDASCMPATLLALDRATDVR
jgi:hypothetical protein